MATVSVVLLNWNSYPVVVHAAASAMAQRGVTVELIIVDNGSQDDSLVRLRSSFRQARIIEMGFNSGFTGGMNAGTDAACGDFVLWQNADLVLAEDYCARAAAALRSDTALGAVGGLVTRLVDGRRTEQFDACGYTLGPFHRAKFIGNRTVPQDVVGVSGSCPVFRRSALDALRATVGYVLDPWYFTYGEDIDLMLRMNLAGWRVRYLPDLRAWHVRSGSTVTASRFYEKPSASQVHHFKNRVATVVKTYPPSLLVVRLPLLAAAELALPVYLLVRGGSHSVVNWLRAWHEVWRERARLLRDRRAIRRAAAPDRIARLRQLLRCA